MGIDTLEGDWRVVWLNGTSADITVQGGRFTCFGFDYSIIANDGVSSATFTWPAMYVPTVTQRVRDMERDRHGKVSVVTWVTLPEQPLMETIRWERTDSDAPPTK